jgi:hypothetical protein
MPPSLELELHFLLFQILLPDRDVPGVIGTIHMEGEVGGDAEPLLALLAPRTEETS